MNKLNLFKKFTSYSLVILYDVLSFFCCYIILSSFIYIFSSASTNENGIGIIGGAGMPTAMFIIAKVWGSFFPIMFVFLSIATVLLLTVSTFKKQINQKSHILLCVFSALSLILFILIPTQTYLIPLYLLVEKLSFFKYLPTLYIVLSIAINVKCLLLAVKLIVGAIKNIKNKRDR